MWSQIKHTWIHVFGVSGCYKDTFENRLLSGSAARSLQDNSMERCLQICTADGYSLAGMQFGKECFCGERSLSELNNNYKVSEDKCDKKCPADSTMTCGGYLTMNLYQTGLVPFKPGPSLLPQKGRYNPMCDNQIFNCAHYLVTKVCDILFHQNTKIIARRVFTHHML